MRRNAARLDLLFNYLGVRDEKTGQFVLERSFFLGNSGYFLLSTEAHAIFLRNGKSCLEKLQKRGWFRLDLQVKDPDVASELHANKFLLFYDKNELVKPHNETNFLKGWKKAKNPLSREENAKLNIELQQNIDENVLNEILDKIHHWREEGAQYFGLPEDWNSSPLKPVKEKQILLVPEVLRAHRRAAAKTKAKQQPSQLQTNEQFEAIELENLPEVIQDKEYDFNADLPWC